MSQWSRTAGPKLWPGAQDSVPNCTMSSSQMFLRSAGVRPVMSALCLTVMAWPSGSV